MTARIFLSSPDVTQAEEDALVRALRSGWVAPLGPEVDAFEAELAAFTGRTYAVALSSGSAALHLGLLQLGAAPATVVITSSMTFAATANAITYTGATPVFVDSDETGNMDPDLLAEAIDDQVRGGADVAAIVPVDLIGKVADHRAIGEIASARDVPVLVDAAESLGASREGRRAGQDGVASIVSFNGNKIMTTSGGGALLCDDPDMAARTRYLATQARQPVVHYEHVDVGYNYRMSNLLAAVGRAQLERLPSMLERRRGWRRRYAELFDPVDGVTVFGGDDGRDAPAGADHDNFWLTSVVVDPAVAGWTADELRADLARDDIEARPLWKPMHLQPVFAACPAYVNGTSERFFRTGLSLPSGSALSDEQFERVRVHILSFLEGKSS
ncbi:DegT/DnrJ/EryC1/StrS family aminotransferase [Nocardioides renjunii]|uniref:DegT/DnrJ/EryC1/StrS family aminotransferase n=1 Tax=Nocardioides renjunii TaxID=3095075 RepID=UPI002AFDD91A|nr:aminotransferase class I/II-fold pyridoxal phosphate-dependent enzyme [Nocardioides sp. S-34]WQQ22160.1 aminotransferase class I/II-fold pyridoxal phosphate-dependent enzyme [Nocardioides sp. S-34]